MGSGQRLRPERLPEKLKIIREALGLRQTQMPQALGLADDLTQSMVSAYEYGKREPSLIVLLKYARLARISTDYLLDDALELPPELRRVE